jgi:rubrerythrin
MFPNLRNALDLNFLRHLIETPAGRQHVLSQVADAESTGESRVFEQLLSQVDDPELAKMIEKHQADEIRHAELFRACEARTGLPARTVPTELRLMDRLDAQLGHILAKPITTREGVMDAYLLLQVLEERAITQFGRFIEAFGEIDPETAAVFTQVNLDEERHLKYCHAISRRYAPDEATRLATLARLRHEEALAFRENQLVNLNHTLDTGLIRGTVRRALWRALARVAALAASAPSTPFAQMPAPIAA